MKGDLKVPDYEFFKLNKWNWRSEGTRALSVPKWPSKLPKTSNLHIYGRINKTYPHNMLMCYAIINGVYSRAYVRSDYRTCLDMFHSLLTN